MAAFEDTVGVTDMVLLDNCDGTKLIENLKKRFQKNLIYTYIGEVLISINPYTQLSIYNDDLMVKYYNKNDINEVPHIFATSAKVFKSLKEYRQEQCILISGESGSGKTEASKWVLHFIAKATHGDRNIEMIKNKLLVANSVLEAFGNAKTRNNDNSSRFGKYMDVQFNPMGQPVGGTILHYMLEKSRVSKQACNEKNYHIFYHLINGADECLARLLEIDKDVDYLYLKNDKKYDGHFQNCVGWTYETVTAVPEDSGKFKELSQALKVLEFDSDEITEIFKIIASVLHLGDVKFLEHEGFCEFQNINKVRSVAKLLGVPEDDFIFALTNKTIKAHGEVIWSRLDVETSNFARDALAKAIYCRLFDLLMLRINKTLKINGQKDCRKNKSIGILDIYGFEILQNNGFEQFCINYCNEKLQKLFLDLTLKSEQQDYFNEGIKWTAIDYYDNGSICNMIDEKHKGIISCLEDESFKRTDNVSLVNELAVRFKEHQHFSCYFYESADQQTKKKIISPKEFVIIHYAGPVTYDAFSFLEKNNDSLFEHFGQIMFNSTNKIIKSSFLDCQTPKQKIPETTIKQFKKSLNQLIESLKTKQLTYIKCIKPNDYKYPNDFDDEVVGNQVKYMGLVEILRIRKAGFAYRGKFEEFLKRYKCLSPETWPNWMQRTTKAAEASRRLVEYLGYTDKNDYKIGKTKILIKNPQTVFDIEKRFQAAKPVLATKIQSMWRGYKVRKTYRQLKTAVILCQWLVRRILRHRKLLKILELEKLTKAAVFVQKKIRRLLAVRAYKRKLHATLVIRNFAKGFMTRNDPPNLFNHRFIIYKMSRYLIQLSETLPKSLLDDRWPEPPTCCIEVSKHLKILYRAWLSRIYRSNLAKRPELHELLKFKLAASEIFKGKKSMYPESINIDINYDRDDVLRLWKDNEPIDTNANSVFLYATKVKKFDRRGYKTRDRILVVTSDTILIVEITGKNQKTKDHLPIEHVTSLQMTSGMDKFLLIKISEHLKQSKGDVLLEVPYLVECVAVISKQLPGITDFVNMQTISRMKHVMKNSKKPGFIEFVPVNISERKGKIRKGNNGNLTITG